MRNTRRAKGAASGIVVIADPALGVHVTSSDPAVPVRYFDSKRDYDAWRAGRGVPGGIGEAVHAALSQLGTTLGAHPEHLRLVLTRLCRSTTVPPLKQIAEVDCSRRTFFRRCAALPERPSFFLRRVKRLHAHHLIRRGASAAEAAHAAGYRSEGHLLRDLNDATRAT